MEVQVIRIAPGPSHTLVVLRGASPDAVTSTDAGKLAIASSNITKGAITGNARAYPVDADGNTSDELMFGTSTTKIAGFQCDYRIVPGL